MSCFLDELVSCSSLFGRAIDYCRGPAFYRCCPPVKTPHGYAEICLITYCVSLFIFLKRRQQPVQRVSEILSSRPWLLTLMIEDVISKSNIYALQITSQITRFSFAIRCFS